MHGQLLITSRQYFNDFAVLLQNALRNIGIELLNPILNGMDLVAR